MNAGSLAVDIRAHARGESSPRADRVAVEEPLEIRLGYSTPDGRAIKSVSITMRTPGHDAELAVGFLYTEGILGSAADIAAVEPCGRPAADTGLSNIVRVELAPNVEVEFERLSRHFYTTSSCGVCGKASLDALRVSGVEPPPPGEPLFSEAVITSMPQALRAAQATFAETGGLHAAAAFDAHGDIVAVMEDVGRHNAVDKVVGRLLLDGRLPAHDLGMMVSGRASFELMQKTLVAGMPLLAAVSAPSSLAVSLAREFSMTLVGFLRGDTYNVYAGEARLCR